MSGLVTPKPPSDGVVSVEIDSWAAGGRGLGRVDGRVWMVAGAAPGDRVLARVLSDHGRYVEAVVDTVERASSFRRTPGCPIQSDCGGCPLMVVDESAQRDAKRRFLIDALERIGRFSGSFPVDPMIATPPAVGYRNKIELTFGRSGRSGVVLGYHRSTDAAQLLDVEACAIGDPRLQPLLQAARAYFLSGPGAGDPALGSPLEPLRLVLRASGARDERLVAFRGSQGPFATLTEFARVATSVDPGLAGVVRIVSGSQRRGGAVIETVSGRPWIEDELHGITFRVPAATFLQVHTQAAATLGAHVLDGAGSPAEVVELYGGVGALGLALSRRGARVTIVDADPRAVDCGSEAAQAHGLASALFERSDVLSFLAGRSGHPAPDLVIADPPRTGLGKGVAERLARLGAPRIAMVSCDPATLARDLAELARKGYAVERVAPFDLFPQTAHVEAVAWLRLAEGRRP